LVVPPLPALLTLQLRMAEPGGPLHEHGMPEELVQVSPGLGQEIPSVQSRMPPSRSGIGDPPPAPPVELVVPPAEPVVPPETVELPPLPRPPLPVVPPAFAPPELVCGVDELEQDGPATVIPTATMTIKASGTRGGMLTVYTACAAISGRESTGLALTADAAVDAT